jgi:drug/metabolite transporter (DMT)-like permease
MNTIQEKIKPFTGALLVFAGAFFFSGKAVLVKLGYQEGASVLTMLNLRMLFSLPFFVVMAFISTRQSKEKLSGNDIWTIIFLGIIGYYLASFFDFAGLRYISAGLERLIVFVYPTLVVLISAVVFKTRITKAIIVALVISYIGIFIAFEGEDTSVESNLYLGSLLVFGSAFTYAIYLVGSGRLIPRIGAARFTSYAMLVSTIAVLLHSYFAGDLNLSTTPKVYLIAFCMAVLCTVIPSILLGEGIKKIGSGPAAIIGGIGPVSTILMASVFLGEVITLQQMAGTILVICGVLIVSRKKSSN